MFQGFSCFHVGLEIVFIVFCRFLFSKGCSSCLVFGLWGGGGGQG